MSSSQTTRSATLGLGGNIGNVADTMVKAIDLIQATEGIDITRVSPLYRTPPWGITSQNWFVNACAEIATSLSPHELLEQCQAIESRLHRKRNLRWGPRTIDIDILTFQDFLSDQKVLTVPHPRMLERAFVLVPLADITPDLVVSGKPVSHWLNAVDQAGIERLDTNLKWWPAET